MEVHGNARPRNVVGGVGAIAFAEHVVFGDDARKIRNGHGVAVVGCPWSVRSIFPEAVTKLADLVSTAETPNRFNEVAGRCPRAIMVYPQVIWCQPVQV